VKGLWAVDQSSCCLLLAQAEANIHVQVLAQHAQVQQLELCRGGLA
jgi:hypothetical protein